MLFHEGKPDKSYTVKRIKGRDIARALEGRGIAVGSDLTILAREQDGSALVRLVNGREINLSAVETAGMALEEPRLRRASDPVFLGGCCAYGNTAEVWDKYVNGEAPGDK